jgi:hypothetical protein
MYNFVMSSRILLKSVGLVLLLLSIILVSWGLQTVRYTTKTVDISRTDLIIADVSTQASEPDIPLGRMILQWSEVFRLGDRAEVRLTFSPENKQTNPPQPDGVLRAKLDLAGITHTPTGEISQALTWNHPVIFLWNLRSVQTGRYLGDVWLYLSATNSSQVGPGQKVIFSQQFDSEIVSFLGLSGLHARILGCVGLVIGAFLGLGDWITQLLDGYITRFHSKG